MPVLPAGSCMKHWERKALKHLLKSWAIPGSKPFWKNILLKTTTRLQTENKWWMVMLVLLCLTQCCNSSQAYIRINYPSIHVVKGCYELIYWFCHIHDASHARSCLECLWNLRKCVLNLWLNYKGPLFILAILIYCLQMIALATMGLHRAK